SCIIVPPPRFTLFPYTTLFRSLRGPGLAAVEGDRGAAVARLDDPVRIARVDPQSVVVAVPRRQEIEGLAAVGRAEQPRVLRIDRSEEHTSELQSLAYLVCRLLL